MHVFANGVIALKGNVYGESAFYTPYTPCSMLKHVSSICSPLFLGVPNNLVQHWELGADIT